MGGRLTSQRHCRTKKRMAEQPALPREREDGVPPTVLRLKLDHLYQRNKKEPFAVVVEDLLSAEECSRLIELADDKGFEAALINVGFGKQVHDPDARKSDRCIIGEARTPPPPLPLSSITYCLIGVVDSEEITDIFWHRLCAALSDDTRLQSASWSGRRLEVVGLNERLRFLRYHPGDFFAPHFDGSFVRGKESPPERRGEQSYVTVMIYLNEGCEGGETRFLDLAGKSSYDFVPRAGAALLFEHGLYHEGALVTAGEKYAIRTDVMYRKRPNHDRASESERER
jgi:hypothetical protein